MTRFNLSISNRLIAAFGIMILMVLLAIGVGVWYALQAQQAFEAISVANERLEDISHIQNKWLRTSGTMDGMLLSRKSRFNKQETEIFEDFNHHLEDFKEPITVFSPDYIETNQPAMDEIVKLGDELNVAVDQFLEYSSSSQWAQAQIHRFNVILILQYQFNNLLDDLSANTQAEVERLTIEVDQTQQQALLYWGIAIVVALVTVVISGVAATRSITQPVNLLIDQTRRVTHKDFSQITPSTQQDEIGELSRAFAQMTDMLRESYGLLEEQMLGRTRQLDTVATITERVNVILNVNELLNELVSQIQKQFNYYHTQIYLLDPTSATLVAETGSGTVGKEMKAQGYSIAIDATNTVATAARLGQIVRVDDTHNRNDWQPNPLLPDTRAELAVPIVVEGRVAGVLDVQQDRVAGLDKGDESMLTALANQVAIAIRNAQLFERVETALAEAYESQELYVEKSWEKSQIADIGGSYLYTDPDVSLDKANEKSITDRFQSAPTVSEPSVVSSEDQQGDPTVLAPVNLRGQNIGALQLYVPDKQDWSQDDLAVLEAVSNQLAQTAENLRLIDETRSRAGREETIRAISDKMRGATNLDELVKIAAEELGQRLSAGHTIVKLGRDSLSSEPLREGNGHG